MRVMLACVCVKHRINIIVFQITHTRYISKKSLSRNFSKLTNKNTFYALEEKKNKIFSILQVRRCSNERLDHLLSTDPTLKMCRHCGVVSCTNPKSAFIEQRISPLPTSYFLSTQMFSDIPSSGDDDFRKQHQMGRGGGNKEQTNARLGKYYNVQRKDNRFSRKERMVENGKTYGSREVSLRVKRENNYHLAQPPQRVETMVAERENEDTTQEGSNDEEGKSQSARAKNSSKANSKQICNNVESKEKSRGGKFYAEVQSANKKDWRAKDDMNGNECNEKILRDIVYETPKSELGEAVVENRSSLMSEKRDDESATTKVVHGANSSGNVMAYLARGRLESMDGREKEPASKSGERACVHHARYANNERSFVLHNNRDRNSEFLIRERLVPKEKMARSYEKKMIRLEPVQNLKQFRSATCLMEDDSLENCEPRGEIQIDQTNESNTSMVSSSSAENMIREWVKAPLQRIQDGRYSKSSDTSKPSVIDSKEGRRFWTKEKSVHCGEGWAEERRNQLENKNADEMEKRSSSKNKYSNRQIISSIVGGFKLWSSKESISNKTSEKGEKRPEARKSEKRFGKHLFESFKTFKSLRSVRSKNSSENKSSSATCSLSDRVGNVTRKIIYNESSLKNVIDKNGNYGNKMEDVLLLYRKVLESTEEMDWRSFQRFVENLHPSKRNLWRDICKIIDEKLEVTRGDDKSAEICIEITSTPFEEGKRKERREGSSNEIVFEMDITLGDMERCLGRQLSSTEEEQLDTLKEPSQVIQVRNGEVCDIEEDSNQAE